jgi:hypothetical protein
MSDAHPYAKGTYRRAQHDSDMRDIVIDGLAERYAALLAALDALVIEIAADDGDEDRNDAVRQIERHWADRLAAELAKHREG